MAIQTISTGFNPISGVFGTGQVQMYFASGTWNVPPGIGKVRARVWGGGGAPNGSGGGFSIRTIYDLTGVTSVAVTVGLGGDSAGTGTGGTSSFGSYCSATGGVGSGTVGAGSGGDINNSGGAGGGGAGAGSASLIGSGGRAGTTFGRETKGGAGGGSNDVPTPAGNGFLGLGGTATSLSAANPAGLNMPTSGLQQFSIDFIGTGGGGGASQNGMNGGGGGSSGGYGPNANGGIPGGGGGGTVSFGGQGLVIVEW